MCSNEFLYKKINKTVMNLNELKSSFDKACNEYLKSFCKKHGYDYDPYCWAGNDVGGVAEVADCYVGMDDIRADMDTDAPEDEFLKWYDYCFELGLLGVESTPNFRNWLKGCPRKSEAEMEELRQAHQRVEDAKRILEELITCRK
jgi:hypothetical protein